MAGAKAVDHAIASVTAVAVLRGVGGLGTASFAGWPVDLVTAGSIGGFEGLADFGKEGAAGETGVDEGALRTAKAEDYGVQGDVGVEGVGWAAWV